MNFLINEFRPAQAREDIITILEKQLAYRKNILKEAREFVFNLVYL